MLPGASKVDLVQGEAVVRSESVVVEYPEAAGDALADHRGVGCSERELDLEREALDLVSATISAALPGVVVLVVPARVLGQRAGSRHRVGLELTSS